MWHHAAYPLPGGLQSTEATHTGLASQVNIEFSSGTNPYLSQLWHPWADWQYKKRATNPRDLATQLTLSDPPEEPRGPVGRPAKEEITLIYSRTVSLKSDSIKIALPPAPSKSYSKLWGAPHKWLVSHLSQGFRAAWYGRVEVSGLT